MGQRAASLMTTYEDDDKEVWKSFRRELVAEGFSSDVLTRHKVSTDSHFDIFRELTLIEGCITSLYSANRPERTTRRCACRREGKAASAIGQYPGMARTSSIAGIS